MKQGRIEPTLGHLPMPTTRLHYLSSMTRLIWFDERTGAKVYVDGGMVSITHGAVGSHVMAPDEAAAFADEFANAIVHACAHASRWNAATRQGDGGAQ